MIRHPDIASGAVIIVAGLWVAYVGQTIEVNLIDSTLTARFFPILCAIGLVLSGIGITAKGLLSPATKFPFLMNARVAALMAILLVYFFTFAHVEFRLGAWAVMRASMYMLGARGKRQLIFVPIGVAFAAYFVFRFGFTILLPVWI